MVLKVSFSGLPKVKIIKNFFSSKAYFCGLFCQFFHFGLPFKRYLPQSEQSMNSTCTGTANLACLSAYNSASSLLKKNW